VATTLLDRPQPVCTEQPAADRKAAWIRVVAILVVLGLLAALWRFTSLTPQTVSAWVAPLRTSWYAGPVVIAAFVALGMVMVPVLLMIVASGIAFGPWLGTVYALAGSLTAACVGFGIGRRAGLHRVERVAGSRIRKLTEKLEENGTLAVYVIRKIPMPFFLINVAMGASKISFRDYFVGTVLGMSPIVIALAGFGYQLSQVIEDPTPGKIGIAVAFLAVPLTIAFFVNRALRKRR
jgi:phospholipase D1/2